MRAFESEEVARDVADALSPIRPMGYFIDEREEPVVVVMIPRESRPDLMPQTVAGYRLDYRTSRFTRDEAAATQRRVTSEPRGVARFGVGYDAQADAIQVTGFFPDNDVVARLRAIPGVEVTTVRDDQIMDRPKFGRDRTDR